MTAPKVFISYSHDSQEHKLWVLQLATRLRSCGVDAILDQWDLGPGGDLPHFMEQSIAVATRIVMVCTERYVQKANAGTGGVGYEKMIVTADLMKSIDSARIIPIVREQGVSSLPTFLSSKLYIDLSNQEIFETGFDQLLRELLNAPLFVKPPIGNAPHLPASDKAQPTQQNPLTQFMLALRAVYDVSDDGWIALDVIQSQMGVSKLLFEHARDNAMLAELVRRGRYTQNNMVQVLPKGRDAMIRLAVSSSS